MAQRGQWRSCAQAAVFSARVHKKTAAAAAAAQRKSGVDRVEVCWGKSYVKMAGRTVGSTARYGFG